MPCPIQREPVRHAFHFCPNSRKKFAPCGILSVLQHTSRLAPTDKLDPSSPSTTRDLSGLGEVGSGIPPADLYRELRGMAAMYLSRERPGHTLQPTALVHEAFLRVFGSFSEAPTRQDFFARAAEAMRRVLVDHARRKNAAKRNPDVSERVSRELDRSPTELPPLDVLAIDEALARLEEIDRRAARLVRLRFFVGLTVPEAAQVLEISVSAAEEDWRFARAWLSERLG